MASKSGRTKRTASVQVYRTMKMGNKSFERKCRKKRNTVRAEITNNIMVRIGTHDLFFPQREGIISP